ncbi:cytochrome P450 [Ideonella sp.]|uniref:cytochrome P450 n=1 Tax=Ideonella sp. TaxID=1929293 RepID=UPI0035B2B322
MDLATTTPETPPTTTARPAGARPPGPQRRWWGLPLLREMKADYLGFTAGLHRAHGDISHMHIGAEHAYDLFTPELAREALVDHADALVRWQRGIEIFEQVFGQSVLVTEGATWQRQRRMLQPAFSPKRVAGYAALMRDAALDALDHAVPAGQAQGLVEMDALWTKVAMDVIMRTLFTSRASRDARDAAEATQVLSEAAMREMFWPMTLPDWLPLPGKAKKRRALKALRGLVGRHIAERRAEAADTPCDDLLAHLLALRDEGTGAALSDQEVFDQCMVSFQAGHETSATALLWWSRLMAEHPEVARRAQQEVDAALGSREPGAEDLPALPWLTATLKEAMRLYPPIAALMSRRTTREITLGGWVIPPGAMLRITPWVLQRDARSFSEPDRFMPERFMPDAPPPPRGAWMPFGSGPRVCIGQHFAMLEMTLVAALLLQRYTLALPPGAGQAEPVMNVTLRPRGGVRLLLQRRTPRPQG